jgi:predicted metal-dependent phosphoesterase TrpH
MGRVDLHIHTTASDGAFAPFRVVEGAVARGLTTIAITDHDTTAGIGEALEAAKGTALEVIPGLELNAERGAEEIHILGYYVDHHDGALQKKLEVLRQARLERARKMVKRLTESGMPLCWERVVEIAGESSAFGRPHIALALREEGYVVSTNEAFDKYIGLRGPAYVSRYRLAPVEAVEMIIAAKGLPVLAHARGQERVLPKLMEAGLVGLEAYYPSYSIEESEALVQLARKHNLIPTGGTDLHGHEGFATVALGEVWVPLESVERLRALVMSRVGPAGRQWRARC